MKNKITKFAVISNDTLAEKKPDLDSVKKINDTHIQSQENNKKEKDSNNKVKKPLLLKKEDILQDEILEVKQATDQKYSNTKSRNNSAKIKILSNDFYLNLAPSTLNVKKITKIIKKRVILKNVNLKVNPKEICALLGPNGAGKTTLFSIILGILNPTEGNVFFGNKSLIGLPIHIRAKNGLSYLPQARSIFRGMTVEENIRAVAEVIIEDKEKEDDLVEHLLNEFKISHLRTASALSLSGGEARRVEIARCLCTKPKILLLDEPFAALDPIAITELKEMLKNLVDKGISVFITDHNVKETLEIVHRAYIINQGEIIAEGSPKEIIENKKARQFYLGSSFRL
jgi:lipopolysaccharide export system ATP-binding protein